MSISLFFLHFSIIFYNFFLFFLLGFVLGNAVSLCVRSVLLS
nr:MAG TPA: hypothetical protein [Caudoviricetes sp.]